MKIGGLLKNSLIDFPGRPAMVVFTQGCAWRCPFCHNPRLIARAAKSTVSASSVLDLLALRPERARNLVVSGGEPTLQEDLPDFLRRAKETGARVKLDTNGGRPDRLRQLLAEALVDYVAMDVKGPLARYAKYCGGAVSRKPIAESIRLLKEGNVDYEFRTTVVPALHRAQDFEALGQSLGGGRRLVLQPFRPGNVLSPDLREASPPSPAFLRECAAHAEVYLPTQVR